jgi:hypothetical protein
MANNVLLSPIGNTGQAFTDQFGAPLAGGLIYTYQAGSSTPLSTYTTNQGEIANQNPLICNTDGRLPNEVWLLAQYSYKFVIQTAGGVTLQTLDNIYPILQNSSSAPGNIPVGLISMWSGSLGTIPDGWYLCNGQNNTPDLRNSFIVGAGSTYAVGATGGNKDSILITHTHTPTVTVTDPQHSHAPGSGSAFIGAPNQSQSGRTDGNQATNFANTALASTGITVSVTNANAGTSTGVNANLPPYYALAYIQFQGI